MTVGGRTRYGTYILTYVQEYRRLVLSVGMISADLLHLSAELERLADACVDVIHVDVMDGVFCPQLTVGPALIAALPQEFVVDVHLMISDPLEKVDAYVAAGARSITFHVEATAHPHQLLQRLGEHGVTRGIALNPGTPVGTIEPLLDELDLVLVLAVNPGWPGQSFIPATAGRVKAVKELVAGRDIIVGIDGGVTLENAAQIGLLVPDLVVAGSAVFGASDPRAAIAQLRLDLARGRQGR